jgi:hypothetical protein
MREFKKLSSKNRFDSNTNRNMRLLIVLIAIVSSFVSVKLQTPNTKNSGNEGLKANNFFGKMMNTIKGDLKSSFGALKNISNKTLL